MRTVLSILFSLSLLCSNAQQPITLYIGRTPLLDSGSILNDGYYSAFPMVSDAVSGTAYGILKRSTTHAAAGTLPLMKTVDGGATWTASNLNVSGTDITSSSHSFVRLASGRMVFAWQDGSGVHIGHSDDNSSNVTQTQLITANDANHFRYPSPVMMKVTPQGKILFVYYDVPVSGSYPDLSGIMESSDNGITFTNKSVICSGHPVTSNPISDWGVNETDILCVVNTGVDTTSSWIAIGRTDVPNGATYPRVFKSVDGANTWSCDSITDAGSITDDRGVTITGGFDRRLFYRCNTPNPVCLALFNDSVYCIVGDRRSDGYRLMYTTTSVSGALQNKFNNWNVQHQVGPNYLAYTLAGDIDCGYPVKFIASTHLYVAQYDYSTVSPLPGVDKSIKSFFVKIVQ